MTALMFYKIVYLLTGLSGFIMAVVVIHGSWRDKFSRLYALVNIGLIVWAVGRYLMLVAGNQSEALFGARILYFGSFAIYVFFLHSIIVFLDKEKRRHLVLVLFYTIAVILFLFNGADLIFGTRFFIADVSAKSVFAFYEVPGKVYFLQLFANIFIPLGAFFELIKGYKSISAAKRFQLRYILVSSVIGFVGGSTILALVYDIPIQPVGIPLVAIQFGLITYAIVRYRLFNVKVLLTEFLVFALWIFILVRTIITENVTEQLVNSGLLLFTIFFGLVLIRSVRKEVEQRERIEKLAKELEKTNTALESANERLKELDQLKSEFVSLATHQIRGPITAIKGYASMLLEGDYGAVPEVCRKPVETILQSSSSLAGIVQDYLDVSRIEQGSMKYEISDFDVSTLVADVAAEFKSNIERKGLVLSLEIEPNIFVRADMGKIKQVIENLIDNALKYTEQGSISVSLYLSKVKRKVIFAVKDTGVGIAQETLPHLFKKFSRASDASRANLKGTGLGLYVAKQLVEAQSGRIWAESEGEGKGATFFVELPMKEKI